VFTALKSISDVQLIVVTYKSLSQVQID